MPLTPFPYLVAKHLISESHKGYMTIDELVAQFNAELHIALKQPSKHRRRYAIAPEVNVNPNYIHFGPREALILGLIAQGKYTKEIAFDLNLSMSTISTVRSRIARKLHLETRDILGMKHLVDLYGIDKIPNPPPNKPLNHANHS